MSAPPFASLDFVYMPSGDVAADVAHFTEVLGGELVFAIEAFGTRVAMVRMTAEPPAVLLAGHLEGERIRFSDYHPALRDREAGLRHVTEVLATMGILLDDRPDTFHALLHFITSSSRPVRPVSLMTVWRLDSPIEV